MVKKTKDSRGGISFACNECRFRYGEPEIAEKCEAWCKEHKSCNLEIIKHALREEEHE